jgi:hypothetical protein
MSLSGAQVLRNGDPGMSLSGTQAAGDPDYLTPKSLAPPATYIAPLSGRGCNREERFTFLNACRSGVCI